MQTIKRYLLTHAMEAAVALWFVVAIALALWAGDLTTATLAVTLYAGLIALQRYAARADAYEEHLRKITMDTVRRRMAEDDEKGRPA